MSRHRGRGFSEQPQHQVTFAFGWEMPQLRRIVQFQISCRDRPGMVAVVSLVALLNIHPYADGNGRTARAFCNWILRDGRSEAPYLPLREVSGLSRGGFLLRVREAEYFHKFAPLVDFLNLVSRRLFALGGSSNDADG